MQVITELTNERFFGVGAGEESSIGGQRVEGTKESETLDEFTDKGIHGHHTFGFELAAAFRGVIQRVGRLSSAKRKQLLMVENRPTEPDDLGEVNPKPLTALVQKCEYSRGKF
jgi:hypothetical protein